MSERDRCQCKKPKTAFPWISVADRLPDLHDVYDDDGRCFRASAPVLAFCSSADPSLRMSIATVEVYDSNRVFWADSEFGHNLSVSYWMPLPEAPGGDKDV